MQRVLAKLGMISKSESLRKTCFFCEESSVAQCACEVPMRDTFEYDGTRINYPSMDRFGAGFVHPALYYGEVYYEWASRHPRLHKLLLYRSGGG